MRTPSTIAAELEAAFVGGKSERDLLVLIRELRAAIASADCGVIEPIECTLQIMDVDLCAAVPGSPMYCFNFDDLVMSTTAYYLGRRTINVDSFCDRLVKAWPDLSPNVRDYIQRIVEAEFSREAILKSLDNQFNPFGDDCDRESWCKVRACWQEKSQS